MMEKLFTQAEIEIIDFDKIHSETEIKNFILILSESISDNFLFIEKNEINSSHLDIRLYGLNWIKSVCKKLKISNQSFILAQNIFDQILETTNFDIEDIHLLAICSLIISNKYEEVKNLGYKFAFTHLAKEKFTINKMIQTEIIILKHLKFTLPKDYFPEFTFSIINSLFENVDNSSIFNCCGNEDLKMNFYDGNKLVNFIKWLIFKFCSTIYFKVVKEYVLCKTTLKTELYFSIAYVSFNLINRALNIQEEFYKTKIMELSGIYKSEMNNILYLENKICCLIKNAEDQDHEDIYECLIKSIL